MKDFDFLGITIQYEMCYTNILQILDLAQIPFYAKNRDWDVPVVIGGGPCTYNPEPLADFFDLFYIGEGEIQYDQLFALYKVCRKNGSSRAEFLHEAAKIPGMYVPSLYEVSYKEDGTIEEMKPIFEDVPAKVEKQVVMDLTDAPYPEKADRTFYQGDAGSCGFRDPARLYPRVPFLSSGDDLPAKPRERYFGLKKARLRNVKKYRTRGDIAQLAELQ